MKVADSLCRLRGESSEGAEAGSVAEGEGIHVRRRLKHMEYPMRNVIFLVLVLAGCATSSGIIADGKDSYIVIVAAGHRFTSSGDLKVDAYKDASAFCRKLDKQMETIFERSIQAGVLANASEVELKFKCIPM